MAGTVLAMILDDWLAEHGLRDLRLDSVVKARGRPLTPKERQQRVEAARAGAAKRRKRGIDPDDLIDRLPGKGWKLRGTSDGDHSGSCEACGTNIKIGYFLAHDEGHDVCVGSECAGRMTGLEGKTKTKTRNALDSEAHKLKLDAKDHEQRVGWLNDAIREYDEHGRDWIIEQDDASTFRRLHRSWLRDRRSLGGGDGVNIHEAAGMMRHLAATKTLGDYKAMLRGWLKDGKVPEPAAEPPKAKPPAPSAVERPPVLDAPKRRRKRPSGQLSLFKARR